MNSRDHAFAAPAELGGTFLVAAGWVAIWLLWPFGTKPDNQAPGTMQKTALQTRYFMHSRRTSDSPWSPTLIVLPSKGGFSGALKDDSSNGEQYFSSTRRDPSIILGRPERIRPRFAPDRNDDSVPLHFSTERDSVPVPSEKPVLDPGLNLNEVVLSMSPELSKLGFELRDVSGADLPQTAMPWAAVARIETDADGRVTHVFLEMPTDSDQVNTAVVRVLYRGRLNRAQAPTSGTVTVSRR